MLAEWHMDPLTASAIERLAWAAGAVGVLIAAAVFYAGRQIRRHADRGRDHHGLVSPASLAVSTTGPPDGFRRRYANAVVATVPAAMAARRNVRRLK